MGLPDWLGNWLGNWFGKRRSKAALTVPLFDVASGQVVQIPARELRPGMVQARVQGIDGLVWVAPDQLHQGDIRHPPFDNSIRACIRQIQDTFAERRPVSFEEWEDGFRRDAHPEQEIALWLHAGQVYTTFAASEPSAERRQDIYRCIIACLTSGRDGVWHVLRPAALSRVEAEPIVDQFFRKRTADGASDGPRQ